MPIGSDTTRPAVVSRAPATAAATVFAAPTVALPAAFTTVHQSAAHRPDAVGGRVRYRFDHCFNSSTHRRRQRNRQPGRGFDGTSARHHGFHRCLVGVAHAEHHLGQPDPVGDGVVGADDDGAADRAVLQVHALDQEHHPQRAGARQRLRPLLGHEALQRRDIAWRGQPDSLDMSGQLEAGVVHPRPAVVGLHWLVVVDGESPDDPLPGDLEDRVVAGVRRHDHHAVDDHQIVRPVHPQPQRILHAHRGSCAAHVEPPRILVSGPAACPRPGSTCRAAADGTAGDPSRLEAKGRNRRSLDLCRARLPGSMGLPALTLFARFGCNGGPRPRPRAGLSCRPRRSR